jgi:hypothetical protein
MEQVTVDIILMGSVAEKIDVLARYLALANRSFLYRSDSTRANLYSVPKRK